MITPRSGGITRDELWSLKQSETAHTFKVRLVYFKSQHCDNCGNRSCDDHMWEMNFVDSLDDKQLCEPFGVYDFYRRRFKIN